MQVPRDVAGIVHTRVKERAEVAYNLSHANVVNTLSHEIKRFSGSEDGQRVQFKLYMIQARHSPLAVYLLPPPPAFA